MGSGVPLLEWAHARESQRARLLAAFGTKGIAPRREVQMTRRGFLGTAMAAAAAGQGSGSDDIAKLISQSDLVYEKPVPRSEEGMPIGNGRMGTLVWTTPVSLRMQINRVDVYGNDSTTNSFF